MALARMWRRVRNFMRWKKATTPMLLNADTGELIPFSNYTAPPTGKWMLRRPLALPESTLPLFLEARLIPGVPNVPKGPTAPDASVHQVGPPHQPGAAAPPPQPSVSTAA